jgi:acetyl esterase/lipase
VKTRLILAALCLFATALPAAALELPVAPAPREVTPKPDVKVERDILYATIDGEKLYLDIAMPGQPGQYPCVVMFHGGAWVTGSRKDLSVGGRDRSGRTAPSIMEMVAARGYVAVSVGYRLAPKHKFPAQMQDARAAVRFLREHAKQYQIDKDKFAAGGFSAGGHIALLLGLADKAEGWDAGGDTSESAKVQCVIDFFGPTDLTLYTSTAVIEDGYLVPVFGKDAKTDPKVYKKASPINYVTKDVPPILMIHGTFDLIVPVIHSENMLKKLKDAGATAELITVRGEGHGWGGAALTRSLNDSIKFLDTHLKGKK